ncbi:MAG: hypothetical protein KDE27_25940 [Planctomycetes bacterium]|nr:hypothetical protein [Planctomycetota bacterium]
MAARTSGCRRRRGRHRQRFRHPADSGSPRRPRRHRRDVGGCRIMTRKTLSARALFAVALALRAAGCQGLPDQMDTAFTRFAFDAPMAILLGDPDAELLPASLATLRFGRSVPARLPVAVGVENGVWTLGNGVVPGMPELEPANAPYPFPGDPGQLARIAAADADGDGRDEVFFLSAAPADDPDLTSRLSVGALRGVAGIRRRLPGLDLGNGLRDLAAHGESVLLATGRPRASAVAVAVGVDRAVIVDCRRTTGEKGRPGPFALSLVQTLPLPGTAIAVERLVLGQTCFFVVLGDFVVSGLERPAFVTLAPITGTDQYAASAPTPIAAAWPEHATCLAVADLDADGDPDVVAGLLSQDPVALSAGRVTAFSPAIAFGTDGVANLVLAPTAASARTRGVPTALAVADFGPTRGVGSDGVVDVAVAGTTGKHVTVEIIRGIGEPGEPAFGDVERLPLSIDEAVVADEWAIEGLPSMTTPVTDMIAGHFNGDDVPDLLLAEPRDGQLVVLEGQPPPIATFVEVAIHGHHGINSIFGITSEPEEIDAFLDGVRELGLLINLERRGRLDLTELPPVRVIAVTGHWAELTERGAFSHALARALWSAGSYLPAPMCTTLLNLPAAPAPDPLCYWSTLVFLLVPVIEPGAVCGQFLGGPDPALVARFALGGLGFGVEKWGALLSSAASRAAGDQVAARVDAAVREARAGMDPCDGLVFVHVSGHRRAPRVPSRDARDAPRRDRSFAHGCVAAVGAQRLLRPRHAGRAHRQRADVPVPRLVALAVHPRGLDRARHPAVDLVPAAAPALRPGECGRELPAHAAGAVGPHRRGRSDRLLARRDRHAGRLRPRTDAAVAVPGRAAGRRRVPRQHAARHRRRLLDRSRPQRRQRRDCSDLLRQHQCARLAVTDRHVAAASRHRTAARLAARLVRRRRSGDRNGGLAGGVSARR